jgi:hypothetical protein
VGRYPGNNREMRVDRRKRKKKKKKGNIRGQKWTK